VDAIVDGASGFFAGGLPAVLDDNLIVTYGGAPAVNDVLVALMTQQADVLADQLKAGETGVADDKDPKKLSVCN
jgi:hypothetical protein